MSAPTMDDAAKWTMVEDRHVNGGKDWFGYLHRCVQQPRLSRFDKYTRADKSVTSTWRVDGEDAGDLRAAIDELAYPARLTLEEALALVQIGTEPADHRKTVPFEIRMALHDKGAIAYGPPGRCRRALSVADLLDAFGRLESNASGNPEWERVSGAVNEARAVLAKAEARA